MKEEIMELWDAYDTNLNKIKYNFYKYRLTKIVDIYKIQLYLNI